MTDKTARCETCRFRFPDTRPGYENNGHCRRYPPQINVWTETGFDQPSRPGFEQQWPWMDRDDWCGEHQPKDQPHDQ